MTKGRPRRMVSESDRLREIRRLAIIGMFSDDDLMETLVLKGGNALDIVYEVAQRASLDLDFSIEGSFTAEELVAFKQKATRALTTTFREKGYQVFDVKLKERPPEITADMADFWGGCRMEFKIIEIKKHGELKGDLGSMRRQAVEVSPAHGRRVVIDISKFEYCKPKQAEDLDGFRVFVYSPAMIACEKIRAICQQMPEYLQAMKSQSGSARARDFFDIYTICGGCDIDLAAPENMELLALVFEAKRVPLRLIGKIHQYREYHRQDFGAVVETVHRGVKLREFDFYFDYVVQTCETLESLWIK